jgi:hypothetical protein
MRARPADNPVARPGNARGKRREGVRRTAHTRHAAVAAPGAGQARGDGHLAIPAAGPATGRPLGRHRRRREPPVVVAAPAPHGAVTHHRARRRVAHRDLHRAAQPRHGHRREHGECALLVCAELVAAVVAPAAQRAVGDDDAVVTLPARHAHDRRLARSGLARVDAGVAQGPAGFGLGGLGCAVEAYATGRVLRPEHPVAEGSACAAPPTAYGAVRMQRAGGARRDRHLGDPRQALHPRGERPWDGRAVAHPAVGVVAPAPRAAVSLGGAGEAAAGRDGHHVAQPLDGAVAASGLAVARRGGRSSAPRPLGRRYSRGRGGGS